MASALLYAVTNVMRSHIPLALLLVTSGVVGGACSSGSPSSSGSPGGPSTIGGDADAAAPFEPDPPRVYVAKVKNILVGLAPEDGEIKAVEADPTQLKALITKWMALPEYTTKMRRFFELAFQQTQVSIVDFADQSYPRPADVNQSTEPLLVQNATESFARTMLELIAEKRPFTEAMTTPKLMMTPALMEFYAFLDAWQVDDTGYPTDRVRKLHPNLTVTVEASQGPIPLSETLDPASPNYMHWYDPDVGHAPYLQAEGCTQDPIVFKNAGADTLHFLMFGALTGIKASSCTQYGGTAAAPQLTASDFNTWKMVTIRPPRGTEEPTALYDLPTLRTTNELVLSVPRIGFFSTPAFFANWQTNKSNQMRVTTNQALIVATGGAVDGTDSTSPPTTPGLDTVHATETACVGCHRTLDPTRSILAATYSWDYHTQTETAYSTQPGLFAFENVIKPVATVSDFATILATHPLFGQAWAQKLCYYANSAACEPSDPEFKRIVGVFDSSGYSWPALVTELLASPLTTNAAATSTRTNQGKVVAVSRRDHLCAALNARLGLTDICGLDATTKPATVTTIPQIVAGLPSDGYGRGAAAPVLPNQPTLFYRAGTENICEAAAALVIDAPMAKRIPNAKQWSSAQPDAAISDFVLTIMALAPSDARATSAQQLLKSHFTSAMQSGATATAALQSTFVTACLAPSAVSIGM